MVNVNASDRALFLKKDFERRAALVAVVMERLKLELLLEKCFLLFHGPACESHFFGARARIEPARERFVLRLARAER